MNQNGGRGDFSVVYHFFTKHLTSNNGDHKRVVLQLQSAVFYRRERFRTAHKTNRWYTSLLIKRGSSNLDNCTHSLL